MLKQVTIFLSLMLPAQIAISSGQQTLTKPAEWEYVGDDEGVRVFFKEVKGVNLLAFKGMVTLDEPLAKVTSAIVDYNRAHEWIPHLESSKVLKQITPKERIQYSHISPPWPLQDRYYIIRGKMEVDRKAGVVALKFRSEENPSHVEEDKILGFLINSAFTLEKVGSSQTKVTVEIHTDPKGSVPQWLVNFVQKKYPRKFLGNLRKQLKKKDVTTSAHIEKLLGKVSQMKQAASE